MVLGPGKDGEDLLRDDLTLSVSFVSYVPPVHLSSPSKLKTCSEGLFPECNSVDGRSGVFIEEVM